MGLLLTTGESGKNGEVTVSAFVHEPSSISGSKSTRRSRWCIFALIFPIRLVSLVAFYLCTARHMHISTDKVAVKHM